jgi:LCP family protein required for cell wall assembly
MTNDRTEQLIRDAFADEAARAADPREVLAAVRGKQPRRSYGLMLATAAVVVVVAAVATFVVPKVFRESTPPAADQQNATTAAVTPTNVLVVGTDGHGYTDSILLVQVTADGTTNVVSLPRDTWLASANTKLNQIYAQSGADALRTAVSDLTGVPVEHYVALDTAAVGILAAQVGGVEVCLRSAVSDQFSGADLPAGKQVINGEQAVAFLRQRHGLPGGDLDRIIRLQVFLQGVWRKADGKDISVPALLDAVKGHVQVDKGLDVAGLVAGISSGKVRYGTIPFLDVDFQTPENGSAIAIDPAQVKEFVANLPSTAPPESGGVTCVN